MILFSPSLALTAPTADFGPDNPIIGYHNLVTTTNIVADNEAAGSPIINVANPATYQRWTSDSDDQQTITIDVSYLENIDYIAIARHNFSSGVDVLIEILTEIEDSDGFFEYEEVTPSFIPEDDSPILIRYTPQVTSSIRITLTPEMSIIPTIGVIYVGKLLILPRRIYVGHTPVTDGVDTDFTNGMSESGEFLGRIIKGEVASTSVNMQNIDPTWYRNYMREFIRAGKERPFFFGWRPQSFPREIGYAWLATNPRPRNQRPNGMMEIDLEMGALAL